MPKPTVQIEHIAEVMGKRLWIPVRAIGPSLAKRPEYAGIDPREISRAAQKAVARPCIHDGMYYYTSLATPEVKAKWEQKEERTLKHHMWTKKIKGKEATRLKRVLAANKASEYMWCVYRAPTERLMAKKRMADRGLVPE